MNKTLTFSLALFLLTGCYSKSEKELFKETDFFVQSLNTTYESYGIFGSRDDAKTTPDGLYTIMPIGRLINVKIEKAVEDKDYEALRKDLEHRYKGDKRVNKVYICNGGTVMIDCRN